MSKYSVDLIKNYINGEDLGDYSIDELENDKDFMIKVIDYSNDKNMYNLCSDELKKDYDFIKYLILKFKDDIDFITKIADEFLGIVDDSLERTELVIIMTELTASDEEVNPKYRLLSEIIYSAKKLEFDIWKEQTDSQYIYDQIEMGFWFLFDDYNGSDIVVDFYARKLIESIICENNINVSKILHDRFRTAEDVNAFGLNNFMIDFIGMYDSMLASYLVTHTELLSDFEERINKALAKWDEYTYELEKNKYLEMIDKVHEYMFGLYCFFSEVDILYFIGKKLGIVENIAKYDEIDQDLYESIMENISDEMYEKTIMNDFVSRYHYNKIKKLIIDVLYSKESDEPEEPDFNQEKMRQLKSKGKIVKFKA